MWVTMMSMTIVGVLFILASGGLVFLCFGLAKMGLVALALGYLGRVTVQGSVGSLPIY